VVDELKAGRVQCEVLPAPLDHSPMQVDPEVLARALVLLDELARDAPATTAEVEHRLVGRGRKIRVPELAARVVEGGRVGGPDELAHLERWDGQVVRGHAARGLLRQ
jgi:hypothetical protein